MNLLYKVWQTAFLQTAFLPSAKMPSAKRVKYRPRIKTYQTTMLKITTTMLKITTTQFAGLPDGERWIRPTLAPPATGKTRTITAYLWTLSGRVPVDCEARTRNAPADAPPTSVTIDGLRIGTVTREQHPDGTRVYVNGVNVEQGAFVDMMNVAGQPVELLRVCADAEYLTRDGFTADDLRALLLRAGYIRDARPGLLRKEIAALCAQLKQASASAVSTLAPLTCVCEPLTKAEADFADAYHTAVRTVDAGLLKSCRVCGAELPVDKVAALRAAFNAADALVTDTNREECERIERKEAAYLDEQQRAGDVLRILNGAARARVDAARIEGEIAAKTRELSEMDARSVTVALPQGVRLVTEVTLKNGTTKPTCQLYYTDAAGVENPLRSVNYAKRIELCVRILDKARDTANVPAADCPIIIDNAENLPVKSWAIENVITYGMTPPDE